MSPPFRLPVEPDDGVIDRVAIDLVVSGERLVTLRRTERAIAAEELRRRGLSVSQIAARLGASEKTIGRICAKDQAHRPAYARLR